MTTTYKPSDRAISWANEAIDEDNREGEGTAFDYEGFGNYFLADGGDDRDAWIADLEDAWTIYCAIKDAKKRAVEPSDRIECDGHEEVTTADGHGAYCKHCGETLA